MASVAAGFDSFDASALAKRNIALCNTPNLASDPVADQVLYMALSLFRYFHVFERLANDYKHASDCRVALETSGWDFESGMPKVFADKRNGSDYAIENDKSVKKPGFGFGEWVAGRPVRQPRGHTVGIIGFGGIGKEIGRRLSTIGMKVIYHKRKPLNEVENQSLGYEATFYEDVDELFRNSNLLVLACPLNEKTRYIINERSLQLLPQEAKLINIGRGPLIDTAALIKALKSGRLSGAAIDVFEHEPIIEPELCSRWDVIVNPHIGSSTIETAQRSIENCSKNIYNVFYGDSKDITRVN